MAEYVGEQGWEDGPHYAGSKSGPPQDQYLRRWTLSLGHASALGTPVEGTGGTEQLIVTTSQTAAGEQRGHDLRMHFEVRHADVTAATPNTAVITVYNLKRATAKAIVQEFNSVTLEAGYEHGRYGIIFQGTIKQFKRGRESATDSYLTIFASDGDVATNFGVPNVTLPAGWTPDRLRKVLTDAYAAHGVGEGRVARDPNGGLVHVRPYVLSGMAVDEALSYAATTRQAWSVQDGKLQIQPLTAYAPGDIAVINAHTGLIGEPELTDQGLQLTCLLNPMLYIKQQIQIDNESVNQMLAPGGGRLAGTPGTQFPALTSPLPFFASEAADGRYAILVLDHEGDTRGLEWYTHILALNIDPTVGAQDARDQIAAMNPKTGSDAPPASDGTPPADDVSGV